MLYTFYDELHHIYMCMYCIYLLFLVLLLLSQQILYMYIHISCVIVIGRMVHHAKWSNGSTDELHVLHGHTIVIIDDSCTPPFVHLCCCIAMRANIYCTYMYIQMRWAGVSMVDKLVV